MASYYYLISSLPMLKSEETVPMDYPRFLELCESCVSASTYDALCHIDHSKKHPFLREWSQFYETLTEELSYQRKLKMGRACIAPGNRPGDVVNQVAAALAAKNPLVAEQMLLNLQFKKLDSMIGLHYFDEYALFGYAVKLRLLERKTAFKQDKGRTEFVSLLDGVKNQIITME